MILRLVTFSLLLTLLACADTEIIDPSECKNELSEQEQSAGWRLLLDGHSLDQWRSYHEDEVNSGWANENGCLARVGWGGDIIIREQFADFELDEQYRDKTSKVDCTTSTIYRFRSLRNLV